MRLRQRLGLRLGMVILGLEVARVRKVRRYAVSSFALGFLRACVCVCVCVFCILSQGRTAVLSIIKLYVRGEY